MLDTSPYFRLKPYDHQHDVWEETRDLEGFALFWEMGAGKSCATIGKTSWLYKRDQIDGLVILAPNGVHQNWVTDELPTHMPDDLQSSMQTLVWHSNKAKNKKTQQALAELLDHDGLSILVMAYDAVMTDTGSKALKQFLVQRKCLYVLDESGRIKTPGAKRTKRILASAKYAPFRLVLSGTPVDNSPFDVYTQVKFICPDVWKDRGITNFSVFKARYGLWEKRLNRAQGRQFNQLLRYCNLDELRDIVDSVGSRLLKSDVLDLPAKIYTKRTFTLDPKQAKAYKDLDKQFMTWLDDNGTATADLVLTRMLRMSQLCSGFLKNDDEVVVPVGKNVRLRTLQDVLEDVTGSVIIWTRWSWELDEIRKVLGEDDAVYYDGRTSTEDRQDAIQRFQREGTARYFVAKASAAGEGLTLHRAKTVVYMSNTYSLRERLQSEDRPHRAGMTNDPVTYIDIVAEGTYDEKLLQSLRNKRNTASLITGDILTPWA